MGGRQYRRITALAVAGVTGGGRGGGAGRRARAPALASTRSAGRP